jgi:transaldolase
MDTLENLKVKIFADGADELEMLQMNKNHLIKGMTTNPTLMKKAGINDYEGFCKNICSVIKEKPISFEVFSDELIEMQRQAYKIAGWGSNVYVKIPITNTLGVSTGDLVKKLTADGVKVNITAIMTLDQVREVLEALDPKIPSYISIFAGRIADTGVDPLPIMVSALELIAKNPKAELIWASPRELLNIFQANSIGCHVITATGDILNKLTKVGYNLTSYSLDTVKMFRNDAIAAGFKL